MKCLFSCGLLLVIAAPPVVAEEFVLHHEHVLGTSLELRVEAPSRELAAAAERCALDTIDRLDQTLSEYRSDSEFSRWRAGRLRQDELSEELKQVMAAAEFWRLRSRGAFEPRVEELTCLWKNAAAESRIPTSLERREAVDRIQSDADGVRLSFNGLAKGFIIDEVCDVIREQCPKVTGLVVNIGGDIRRTGSSPVKLVVADPRDATVNAAPLAVVDSREPLALATSGGYRRGFQIQGHHYSHLIDPRTGLPQSMVLSASVVAASAIDADAAATALSIMGPQEGMALVESMDGVDCLLVTQSGILTSTNWPGELGQDEGAGKKAPAAGKDSGLLVEFTLNRPKSRRRYRRPYVAVWLEDVDGFPVKTAVLWIQTEQPGPRWHRDLTRWYRNDRLRLLVEKKKMIGTVSGATRGPGDYKARFDGTDNTGKQLKPGKYTLCIEAAREHGTYQIIRKSVSIGGDPIERTELKGNTEVSRAAFKWVPVESKETKPKQ